MKQKIQFEFAEIFWQNVIWKTKFQTLFQHCHLFVAYKGRIFNELKTQFELFQLSMSRRVYKMKLYIFPWNSWKYIFAIFAIFAIFRFLFLTFPNWHVCDFKLFSINKKSLKVSFLSNPLWRHKKGEVGCKVDGLHVQYATEVVSEGGDANFHHVVHGLSGIQPAVCQT